MSLELYLNAITSLPREKVNEPFLVELTPHLSRKEHDRLIQLYDSEKDQYIVLPPTKVQNAYHVAFMRHGRITYHSAQRLPDENNMGPYYKTNKDLQKDIKKAVKYANKNWELIEDNWKYFAACETKHLYFFAFDRDKIKEQTQNITVARELQGERLCIYINCKQKPTLKELRLHIPKKTEPIKAERIQIF
jgi:hypothetical protein